MGHPPPPPGTVEMLPLVAVQLAVMMGAICRYQ
jgi:hypothetical protein